MTARVTWADHDPRWDQPGIERNGAWWVTDVKGGGSGRVGVAIGLDPSTPVDVAGTTAAAQTWFEVLPWFFHDSQIVLRTPGPLGLFLPTMDRERDTLRALCQALALRPTLRARLAEPERGHRLAADIAARPLRARPEPWGLRPSTTNVLGALHSLGYRHEIGGRPLPGDIQTPLDQIVDRVIDRLSTSPHTRHATMHHGTIATLIERHHLHVDPWPFAPLTTPAHTTQQRRAHPGPGA